MLSRTFIVFHDCSHQSYTPNKTLNYIISHITGTFTFFTPNWVLDHRVHHLTNGNRENKYTSSMFYYINLFLYISLQFPVLLYKLINPFVM